MKWRRKHSIRSRQFIAERRRCRHTRYQGFRKREAPGSRPFDGRGHGRASLLSWLQGYDRIIMIDATLDNNPPGTVRLIQPRYATDFPPLMSAHEIGLKDMIDAMILTDDLPETHLIVISALNINEVGMDLTPEVKAAVPKVIRMIQEIISIHNRAYRQ